jgi:hypothetical protein
MEREGDGQDPLNLKNDDDKRPLLHLVGEDQGIA